MKEKEIPAVVYKYIPSTYASSVLKGGMMRIASRTGYNDPFEMQYQWEKELDDINKALSLFPNGPNTKIQIEEFLPAIKKNKEETDCQQDNISDPRNLLALIEALIRICSFMKKHDSITMWSHYANDHQGICVKFNPHILTEAMCRHFDQQKCVE